MLKYELINMLAKLDVFFIFDIGLSMKHVRNFIFPWVKNFMCIREKKRSDDTVSIP